MMSMAASDTILLPIQRDNTDPHYRYKMPKLTAKVEGNGNGIKTVLTNISQVARSLGRPASYPTKYFGCELGAQVQMQDDLYIVNGAHDPERLLALLYAFIKRFVLCAKCANPETELSVCGGGSGAIRQKCKACGHVHTIDKSAHKLTTYIVNHPPNGLEFNNNNTTTETATTTTTTSNGSTKDSKSSSSKKKNGGAGKLVEVVVESKSSSSKGSKSKKQHQEVETKDEEDEEAAFDDEELSEQAYLERLHDGLATGMFINDPKKSADVFYKLVKAKKEAGLLTDASVQRELVNEACLLGIRDKATLILGELLFTERIFDEIVAYRTFLLRFCTSNPKAQKYLLGAYEKIIGDVYKDALFSNATKILKQLYDEDIVEEETIIEWASKESKKYVSKEMSKKIRERVAPFIKWLKEAELDDDDDDDDDEDEEAETKEKPTNGNNNGSNGQQTKVKTTTTTTTTNGQHSDESSSAHEEDDGFLEFSHRVSGIQIQSNEQHKNGLAKQSNGHENEDENDIDIDNI